jgi:hypothetical protein
MFKMTSGFFKSCRRVVKLADWNNGPGPQEYYQRGLPLATVIRRCLMFGYTSGGNDIPAGPIKGYDKRGVFGSVRVGTQGMDRFPKHKE